MKFGKEFAAQMVPEWQQAYMDYNMLKNILKGILRYRQQRIPPSPAAGGGGGGLKRKMTMYRAFSGLTRPYSNLRSGGGEEEQVILVNSAAADGDGVRSSERYETMFFMASDEGGEYETVYFKRLDDEFNKANSFYMSKVQEVMAEADTLTRQMNALIAFRLRVENPSRYHQGFLASSLSPNSSNTTPDLLPKPTTTARLEKAARMDVIQEVEMSSEGSLREITEVGVIDVDEPHNHKSAPQKKPHTKSSKPAPVEVLDHVKINVSLDTPRSTIKGMLMDSKCKELSFSKEELRKAEEQLKRAFAEFYQKLRLLKSYSFLNLLAFSKIMKKYDKITSRSASRSYLNMVDNSYLGSSEEVTRLLERVEETFIKHFTNSNRRKGMNTLRPTARRERHRTTFLLGFAAGCSIALLVALILIVRAQILAFGEVIPQAICTRYGLAVGANFVWLVRILMIVCYPIAYPVGKLLDCVLGHNESALFRRAQLKALVSIHSKEAGKGGELTHDETTIISGALDLTEKTAEEAMTPIESTFSLDVNSKLDWEAIGKILARGHSRVPVYSGNPKNIIGLLLVKSLLTVRAETETPVSAVSIRRIPRVPSDMPLYDILNEFQKGSSHMAAVVKAKGKNKNPQIVGDGEKSEEYKAASAETTLTTPLLSRLDEKSDTVVLDIEKETSRQFNANGLASLQQHEAVNSVGSRSIEDIEDGEVVGIITLEDVFEELLQEEIVDETDEYVDVHKRIRVAAAAAASSVARAPSYRRLTSQKGTQNRQGQQPFTPPKKPIDEELSSTKIQVSFVEPPGGNKR